MAHVEDRWFKTVSGAKVKTARYGKGLRWRAVWKAADGRRLSLAVDRRVDGLRYAEMKESDAAWVRKLRHEYAEEIRLYTGRASDGAR
jgi:hypothetical protein